MTDSNTNVPATTQQPGVIPAAVASRFAALVNVETHEIIREVKPKPSDLAKIVVPAGGGDFFTIERLEGPEPAKTLEIVVAYESPEQRAFYAVPIGEGDGNAPPDCSSADGIRGFGVRDVEALTAGDETHIPPPTAQACADCPFSKFGSSLKGGEGQACGTHIRAIVFDPAGALPMVLQIPPTSIKSWRKYKLRLAGASKRISRVVSRVSLSKVGSGRTAYSVLDFAFVRALDPGETAALAGVASTIAEVMFAPISASGAGSAQAAPPTTG